MLKRGARSEQGEEGVAREVLRTGEVAEWSRRREKVWLEVG